jgi:hypothetical protein
LETQFREDLQSPQTNRSSSHDFANYVIIPDKILFFGIQRKMTLNLSSCILLRIRYPDLDQNIITRFTDSLNWSFFPLFISLACSDWEMPSDIINHFRRWTMITPITLEQDNTVEQIADTHKEKWTGIYITFQVLVLFDTTGCLHCTPTVTTPMMIGLSVYLP